MKIADQQIENISQLIEYLSKDSIGIKGSMWYRGHCDVNWKLIPSIFRNSYESEINFMKKFKQDATLLVDLIPTKPYEWLFIMRHHNVPTRLLDWSESPLVALYFAVSENCDSDGALWVILPLELNKQEGRTLDEPDNLPSFEEDEFMKAYSPENYSKDKMSKMLPVAFIAPRNTPRMQSQLSVFTISHRDNTPMEEIGDKNHVWRYIIPKSCKEKIKKELELLKITKFQLYPELESIGQKLNSSE